MKTILTLLCSSIIIFTTFTPIEKSFSQQHTVEPPYAKWGRIAVDEVKKKYDVTVIDYLHIGWQTLSSNTAQEKFKLWVRSEDNHEFGVYVTVTFETNTDKILSVQFQKTTS